MTADLLKELDEAFAAMKKSLGFASSLDELDQVFFIRDFIMKESFVSHKLSRMVCVRIVETYMSWAGYLQSIVVPNPGSMINVTEHNFFDESEKEKFLPIINRIMALISSNTLNGLTRDRKSEAAFIDSSLALWKELSPKLQEIIGKVNNGWRAHAQQAPLTP